MCFETGIPSEVVLAVVPLAVVDSAVVGAEDSTAVGVKLVTDQPGPAEEEDSDSDSEVVEEEEGVEEREDSVEEKEDSVEEIGVEENEEGRKLEVWATLDEEGVVLLG